jgi:RimJ/RimL family protein N-acetyltransferase
LDVPPVVSARLELVSMSPEFMRASLTGDLERARRLIGAELPAGWPGRAGRPMRLRLRQLAVNPAARAWLLRAIVLREPSPRSVIGHIGFHGEPDPSGTVEVGYAVEEPDRHHGYGREAVAALFAWACREQHVHRFLASVSPTNTASLALVRSLGFHQVGTQWDAEDGEEWLFELFFSDPRASRLC